MGDTAYCIENKEIWICIVENISMSKNNGTWIEISFPPEMPDISAIEYSPNEIGEVVFFTKPEAEAKLEELGCCEDEKASDEERFYQCLNCLYIKDCNLDEKAEDKWGDQMEAAQRIRLIRIIEKMEKNPAFSNKLGIKNTSKYLSEKEQKK